MFNRLKTYLLAGFVMLSTSFTQLFSQSEAPRDSIAMNDKNLADSIAVSENPAHTAATIAFDRFGYERGMTNAALEDAYAFAPDSVRGGATEFQAKYSDADSTTRAKMYPQAFAASYSVNFSKYQGDLTATTIAAYAGHDVADAYKNPENHGLTLIKLFGRERANELVAHLQRDGYATPNNITLCKFVEENVLYLDNNGNVAAYSNASGFGNGGHGNGASGIGGKVSGGTGIKGGVTEGLTTLDVPTNFVEYTDTTGLEGFEPIYIKPQESFSSPAGFSVNLGSRNIPHNFYSGTGEKYKSEEIGAGVSGTFTFPLSTKVEGHITVGGHSAVFHTTSQDKINDPNHYDNKTGVAVFTAEAGLATKWGETSIEYNGYMAQHGTLQQHFTREQSAFIPEGNAIGRVRSYVYQLESADGTQFAVGPEVNATYVSGNDYDDPYDIQEDNRVGYGLAGKVKSGRLSAAFSFTRQVPVCNITMKHAALEHGYLGNITLSYDLIK